ncbi:hypothetical protein EV401DRAFT_736493 [Pisolithus croceorrhizus]|nr:hypothetical protein EV401DRAFT_736493 [Pisolithus croceorrhizus]
MLYTKPTFKFDTKKRRKLPLHKIRYPRLSFVVRAVLRGTLLSSCNVFKKYPARPQFARRCGPTRSRRITDCNVRMLHILCSTTMHHSSVFQGLSRLTFSEETSTTVMYRMVHEIKYLEFRWRPKPLLGEMWFNGWLWKPMTQLRTRLVGAAMGTLKYFISSLGSSPNKKVTIPSDVSLSPTAPSWVYKHRFRPTAVLSCLRSLPLLVHSQSPF